MLSRVEAILGILERHDSSDLSRNLIRQLYMNCETTMCLKNMKVGPFKVEKGVRQGCPLSMILFILAINQVLFAVDPPKIPEPQIPQTAEQWISQNPFKILAYADDLAITGNSKYELQNDLDKANQMVKWLGMKLKPQKCSLLSVAPAKSHGIPRNLEPHWMILRIDQTPIPTLDKMDKYYARATNSSKPT